jgi:cytochrome P450
VFSSNADALNIGNVRPLIPLQIDPPDHVRYRRLLDPLFAPKRMAALESRTAALVHRLVDRFVDRGHCDLASEFTIPLPSEVFLTMFGLPLEELDTFLRMKDGIIRPPGDLEAQAAHRRATAEEMYAYFNKVLDARTADPRDDILSGFLSAELEGRRLTREEILDICFLLMIAGLDTVTASLDCFFAYLAQHSDQRERLVADPALIPNAIEELFRWETPVTGVPRIAVQDVELGGTTIHAGDQIMILLGSANTDEAEFPDAEVVDLGRTVNRHLAFGGGVHRCLGSHLARLELRVALREFHSRIPSYRLAPDAALEYTAGIRSLSSLPLIWEA